MLTETSTEIQNTESVQQIFAAFGRGDVPYMVSQLAPDIYWNSYMEPNVPWAGNFSGNNRTPAFFQAIAENVDVLGFQPQEFVAQGDTVITQGTFSCTSKRTQKSATIKWIMVFRFRDGKVYSYEQFDQHGLGAIFPA
jgi:ketosteroid isomerase-like protein